MGPPRRPLLLLLPALLLVQLQLLTPAAATTPPHDYFRLRRACFVRGSVRKCRVILADCLLKKCSRGEMCALSPANEVVCLPKNSWDVKNCGSESQRKSQPCPSGTTIVGFGRGCNYCIKGSVAPATNRACVVRRSGGGVRRECIDISARCRQRGCPGDTVCGLDLNERITCFPRSVKDFQNCRSESFRLQQPCPADAGIRGFGMGCTFCRGGNPFAPPKRACVVLYRHGGTDKKECVDISERCKRRGCPSSTVCGLDLQEKITCFPQSVRAIQNCQSEAFRLQQPCPADTTIRGFGMGCTFCDSFNPFVVPSPSPAPIVTRACVVRRLEGGAIKRECVDISARCKRRACPGDTVCGLDLNENIVCFPRSVKDYENCRSESFRLQQPCPADAGIRGFGMGCTFCVGGNPFVVPNPSPRPTIPSATERACVVRRLQNGIFKRECIDISDKCKQRACPGDTVCGLDLRENIVCFPRTVKDFENCRSESFRLQQPCPADAGIRGFGMGCTFCIGGNPFAPSPKRACVVLYRHGGTDKKECIDISERCKRRGCPSSTVCGLDLQEKITCFPQSVRAIQNCQSEAFRLQQPCPADTTIRGFGMGCTFCDSFNPFVVPSPSPAPIVTRACVVRRLGKGVVKRECVDISARCKRKACPGDTVCGLDLNENIVCFPRSVKDFENCRSESFRLQQPCPADAGIRGFGMGCTFCVGGNPFVVPNPSPRPTIPSATERACVVRRLQDGIFKRECIDISDQCKQRACPGDTVCGLDLRQNIVCFPRTVKDFENCRSESFRLQQPCPADAGIRGFGMGCTFCIGGNPFAPPPKRACVVLYRHGGTDKKECVDISERCKRRGCPSSTVCGLDLQEKITCFPQSLRVIQNCQSEAFRLQQPCPADTTIRGFGMGCTFCDSFNPFVVPSPSPKPTLPPSSERACVSRRLQDGTYKQECIDISLQCHRRGCPRFSVCGLDLEENITCFPQSVRKFENCRSESFRLKWPCPADSGIRGFGMGCTFCVP
ncbi:uncharacterized protein LOC122382063 [Amphibalanus amphitrite]|uniref:uncharacterized protein LOC122382063 n=1 Tax=Amphibalanus amphitrite TaxID=1232801 RepID=UPI001C91DBEE|nr:uncharacterized protein LOC122382063 [Amphibalanus amphitrite]